MIWVSLVAAEMSGDLVSGWLVLKQLSCKPRISWVNEGPSPIGQGGGQDLKNLVAPRGRTPMRNAPGLKWCP
jgi:hypothetical protein